MADGDGICGELLSSHSKFSARGDVRNDRSDPRAAASIPANIAEGYGRDQTGGFIQFLRIAQGSTREVETHLILAGRIGLLQRDPLSSLLDECERISKMLRSMIRSLEART
jgi:four helix bundle protein